MSWLYACELVCADAKCPGVLVTGVTFAAVQYTAYNILALALVLPPPAPPSPRSQSHLSPLEACHSDESFQMDFSTFEDMTVDMVDGDEGWG